MAGQQSTQAHAQERPDTPPPNPANWGGRLWLMAAIAVGLAVLVLLLLLAFWPQSLAWYSQPPTGVPWTAAPGVYQIPTPAPTAAPTPPATP